MQAQKNRDTDLWEQNRMLQSGIAQRAERDLDNMEEEEARVHLLVRDLKPPFLDGKIVYTTQVDSIKVSKIAYTRLYVMKHPIWLDLQDKDLQQYVPRERKENERGYFEIIIYSLGCWTKVSVGWNSYW